MAPRGNDLKIRVELGATKVREITISVALIVAILLGAIVLSPFS